MTGRRRLGWVVLAFAVLAPAVLTAQDDTPAAVARRVLSTTPFIDGHNDLVDSLRTRASGLGDVFAPEHDLREDAPFQTDIARLRDWNGGRAVLVGLHPLWGSG